jgi:hypothetical protein
MAIKEPRPYFLVVRTEGIKESHDAPADAVIDATHWHPGDGAWEGSYHASIDELIADYEDGGFYKLVQLTCTRAPYEYEIIFIADRSSFEGPTGEELRRKFGL